MRYDYHYIASAVTNVVTTTDKGDNYVRIAAEGHDGDLQRALTDPLTELLLFLQDTYVLLPDKVCGFDEVVCAINRDIVENYDGDPFPEEVIYKAWINGRIGIKTCIWDNSVLRCFVHGELDKLLVAQEADLEGVHELIYDQHTVIIEPNKGRKDHWNLWRVREE